MMPLGRRMLLAVIARTSQRAIAARCRVVESCVSEWASGQARPSHLAALLLELNYGIPYTAWVAGAFARKY
jgi:hypothetical protein